MGECGGGYTAGVGPAARTGGQICGRPRLYAIALAHAANH